MGTSRTFFLPREQKITVTLDAFASGYYWMDGGPGEHPGTPTPLSAATTYTIGPFNFDYKITLFLNSGASTQTIEFAGTDRAQVDEIIENIEALTNTLNDEVATRSNRSLSNLDTVAINGSLIAANDNEIDLGSATKRYRDVFPGNIKTGTAVGNSFKMQGYDADGTSWRTFFNCTAGNIPTMTIEFCTFLVSGAQPAAIADVATGVLALPATNATTINSILAALRGVGIIAT